MSGLQRSTKQHGIWLLLLTSFMLGWWTWGVVFKPKKENYRELWEWKAKQEVIQAEHEARIQKLEETP